MAKADYSHWFRFFHKWGKSISIMEDEEAGILIKAICELESVYCTAFNDAGILPDPSEIPAFDLPKELRYLWNTIESDIAESWYYIVAGKTGGVKGHQSGKMPGVGRGVGRGADTKDNRQQITETDNRYQITDNRQTDGVSPVRLTAQDVGLLLSEGYTETEIEDAEARIDWHKMKSGSAVNYLRGVLKNLKKETLQAQQYNQRSYDAEPARTPGEEFEKLNQIMREGV